MAEIFLWTKTIHLIAVVVWMGGMLTLPLIYYYHAEQLGKKSSALEALSQVETRLLRWWMNPAMALVFLAGIALIMITGAGAPGSGGWIHVKLLLVLVLGGLHGLLAKSRKDLERNSFSRSACFFKKLQCIIFALLVAIIFLAVQKPF